MIAFLSGLFLRKSHNHLILDVNGVGYKVFVTPLTLAHLPQTGEKLALEIYTIVRENELTLYGFPEPAECRLFELLIGASGVGPKLALNILGQCTWKDFIVALEEENVARIKALKGIGEKTAKMLVAELKGKVKDLFDFAPEDHFPSRAKSLQVIQSAETALVNLGYSRNEIQKAFSSMTILADSSLQEIVKESLKTLSNPLFSRALPANP